MPFPFEMLNQGDGKNNDNSLEQPFAVSPLLAFVSKNLLNETSKGIAETAQNFLPSLTIDGGGDST